MKLIIIATFIACSYGAKLNRAYLPPNRAQTSGGSSEFLQTPLLSSSSNDGFRSQGNDNENDAKIYNNVNDDGRFINEGSRQINAFGNYERPERPRAALERTAAILRQVNENDGETYSYAFETENGIIAEENGVATNGTEAQGGYSYTSDNGQVYSVRYTAGQNGFVPEGDHLPTSPPIPEEILLALEQNARDEAAGIYDDGSYKEEKYASTDGGYQSPNFGHSDLNSEVIDDLNDNSVIVNSAHNSEAFQRSSGFAIGASRPFQPSNEITTAYLPPKQRYTSNRGAESGFGSSPRQSSFNPRTGYNY